jgi:RNA polymerase sigma factor (TIGR02999 family)
MIDRTARTDVEANDALRRQFERVYAELKDIAHRQLAGSAAPTLNTTGLVHEAYVRLSRSDIGAIAAGDRNHFFALAARAMRYIVIDHARGRFAEKRGGSAIAVDLEEAGDVANGALSPEDLLRLDEALTAMQSDEPRLAALVELRFFSGLPLEEIAAMQSVSQRTLNRDWRRARAQLYATLYPDG